MYKCYRRLPPDGFQGLNKDSTFALFILNTEFKIDLHCFYSFVLSVYFNYPIFVAHTISHKDKHIHVNMCAGKGSWCVMTAFLIQK